MVLLIFRRSKFAKKNACKEAFREKIGWAAYPSYQVPFRERRVPFLLVNFHFSL